MNKLDKIKNYFYTETKGFEIADIILEDTKSSYLDTIYCYLIKTNKDVDFYIFEGLQTFMNIYPKKDLSLQECYYIHLGFIAEYTSQIIHNNFIINFIKDYSIFPILDRKLKEVVKDIKLNKSVDELSGIANQIRNCYLNLTDYLLNKNLSHNPEFKKDNFVDNIFEFINFVIPGKKYQRLRSFINALSKKGWEYNSNLIHKDSISVFDIMTSHNILNLLISTISNIIVGNEMPFNKIKCPNCESEKFKMKKIDNETSLQYICKDCKTIYNISIDDIVKKI